MNKFLTVAIMLISLKSFALKKDSLITFFEELKTRTLLVCLEPEDEKLVNKLTKKNDIVELDLYRKALKLTNENLKKSVDLCWKLNSSIKYIPIDSLEWFKNNQPTKYGYLIFNGHRVHSSGAINVGSENLPNFSTSGLKLFLAERNLSIGMCNFPSDEIGQEIPQETKENNVLYSPNYVSSAKLIFALYRLSWLYNDAVNNPKMSQIEAVSSGIVKGEKATSFRKKVLFLRTQDCEKKFNIEDAKKHYPYEIRIVSDEDFEKALFSKDPNAICVFVALIGTNTMGNETSYRTKLICMQDAMNANDGSLASFYVTSSGVNNKVLEGFIKMLNNLEKTKAN